MKQHDTPRIKSNLKAWSWVIVLLVVVSSFIFYAFQLFSVTSSNQRTAKVFEQSLIASINQFEYLPDFLGQDSLVLALLYDPTTPHERLSDKLSYIVERSGADDIFVLNPDGTVVASSNYQNLLGRNFYGKNYGFRPYFKHAKSQRKRQFYFAKGATSGIPGFFISSPVVENDRVLGVVVVKLELSDWEKTWRESKDVVVVADSNGVIILSSKSAWKYKSIGNLSDEQQREIALNKQFPDELHESVFTKKSSLSLFAQKGSDEWIIDNNSYLVHGIRMEDTEWKLFHLEKQRNIFVNLFFFFLVASMLGLVSLLLMREQVNKKEMRHKAREVEAQRRQELQMLIDNIHIGVVVFSDNGEILSMNEHAEHLLSFDLTYQNQNEKSQEPQEPPKISNFIDIDIQAEDFDNYLLEDITTPAYHETFTLKDAIMPKENKLDELNKQHGLNKQRAIPVMFSVGKIKRENKTVYLMTIIDITRRKRVEDEILRLNESLEEAVESRTKELRDTQSALVQKNKAVALGNMAATIVHELSQPLAAINSSVAAIQSKLEVENWNGLTESAGRLKPLSNKMNNVVKLLKHFSYDNDDRVEVFSLVELVQQTVDVLHDRFQEKKVKIEFTSNHIDKKIKGNSMKIDLAISNILKNATEAAELNPQESKIIISTELLERTIKLHIEDNGPGVDEPIMGQLFNPYFTTKEVGKGMGLGLSITYEIIQQHGGEIEAVNTADGARFSMTLPLLGKSDKRIQLTENKENAALSNVVE